MKTHTIRLYVKDPDEFGELISRLGGRDERGEMKPSKLQAALSSHQSGRESRQDGDALGTAGHALDALGHILEYIDAQAGGATVSERCPHAWHQSPTSFPCPECGEWRDAGTPAAPQPESSGGGEGDSDESQPVTGDGTGEDVAVWFDRHFAPFDIVADFSELEPPQRAAVEKAFQSACFVGSSSGYKAGRAEGAQIHAQDAECRERKIEELKEKLAAAEAEKTELERRCLAFMTAHREAEERASKAEAERDGLRARVALLEPVASAAYEWAEDYEREELSRPVELRLFDAVACNLIKVKP